MKIQEQIRIVKDLVEAVTEFNGEYQDGWEETIQDGENLLVYLQNSITTNVVGQSEQFACSCGIPPAIRLCEGVETCLKCGDELSK